MQHSAESREADGPDGRDDRSRDGERRAHDQDQDQVYGITTAETSHTQQITRRQKQYLLTMLVRVVAFVAVVAVPGISWPVKIGLCVAATIIPYVAVVRANGGPSREKGPTNLVLGRPGQPELEAAQRGLPSPGEGEDFIVGEWVQREPPESREPREGGAARADTPLSDAPSSGASPANAASGDRASDGTATTDAVFDAQPPDAQFIRVHNGTGAAADPPMTAGPRA